MSELSPADLYIARIAARPPYRRTIYTVFALTATGSLYLRVLLGRSDQILPWYGSVLALYGFGMALMAREPRCRAVYGCFGLLVAAAFTRQALQEWTRAVGLVETGACLALPAAFASLSRDEGFRLRGAVLQSGASQVGATQEDTDEQARSRLDPGRDAGDGPGGGQGIR